MNVTMKIVKTIQVHNYVLYQLNPSMKISKQACTINVLVHVIGMLHIL